MTTTEKDFDGRKEVAEREDAILKTLTKTTALPPPSTPPTPKPGDLPGGD